MVRVRGIANQPPRTLTLTERTPELNPTPNPNQVSLPPGPPSSRASQSLVEPSQSLTGFGVNTPAGTCSFGPGRLGLSSAGQGDGQVLPLAAGQLRIDPSYASAPGYFGRSTAEQDQMHQLQWGQPSLGPVAWQISTAKKRFRERAAPAGEAPNPPPPALLPPHLHPSHSPPSHFPPTALSPSPALHPPPLPSLSSPA